MRTDSGNPAFIEDDNLISLPYCAHPLGYKQYGHICTVLA